MLRCWAYLPVCCVLTAAIGGCKQGPFAPAAKPVTSAPAAPNVFQQQAQTLNSQVGDLNRRVGQLDLNNTDLHRQLAQADQTRQQEKQTAQEQIALLQKQLGDTAARLKEAQVARADADKQVTALQ